MISKQNFNILFIFLKTNFYQQMFSKYFFEKIELCWNTFLKKIPIKIENNLKKSSFS